MTSADNRPTQSDSHLCTTSNLNYFVPALFNLYHQPQVWANIDTTTVCASSNSSPLAQTTSSLLRSKRKPETIRSLWRASTFGVRPTISTKVERFAVAVDTRAMIGAASHRSKRTIPTNHAPSITIIAFRCLP